MSPGSSSTAAPPQTSGSAVALEQTTGQPHAMASVTGSPKPSFRDGKARQSARL